MSAFMERTVDTEMLASFQEEEDLLQNTMREYSELNKREKNTSLRNEGERPFDISYWTEKLNNARPKETATEDHKNLFTGFGNTSGKQPEKKPEPGIFEKVVNWISENPGTAILATLLVGGGAYLLARHLNGNYSENKDSKGSNVKAKKRREKKGATEKNNGASKEENSEFDLSPKEFAIGAVTAAGGALLGTVLEDYSIAAAMPVAAIGLTKKNIPVIAAAIGLALSKPIRNIFCHIFGNNPKAKEMMKEKGYVETMFGFLKPAKGASEDS